MFGTSIRLLRRLDANRVFAILALNDQYDRLVRVILAQGLIVLFKFADVGDGLDLGGEAELRSLQRICQIAIAEENDVGMQQRPALENPRAILRQTTSSLLPCDPLLISGNLVPA